MSKPTLWQRVAVILLMMLISKTDVSGRSIIDDHFLAEGDYATGDMIQPSFSQAKADWKVTQGNLSVSPEGLNLPQSGPSSLRIDLGPVVPNEAVKITLVIQSLAETATNDRFDVVFRNSITGQAYTACLSTNPGYFGSSGFCSYNSSGAMIAGTPSLSLPLNRAESYLTFQFTPGAGSNVYLNSDLAAQWPDYLQLSSIDRIEIHSTGGGWILMSAQIDASLEQAALPGWIAQREAERESIAQYEAERPGVRKSYSSPRSASWINALRPAGTPVALEWVQNGVAGYSILLPANPTPQDRKASRLLKAALDASFGVDFPIAGSSASNPETLRGKVLSLGETTRVPSGFPRIPLGDEGYQLASGADGDVLFLGGRRRGPINAVIAFLAEDLGVRWYSRYYPPSYPDLSGQTPGVVFRHYLPGLEIRDPGFVEAWDSEWALLNHTNGAIPFAPVDSRYGGSSGHAPGLYAHTLNRLLPPAVFFPTHPEYFAKIGGIRRSPANGIAHWCFSNDELPDVIFHSIENEMAANPDAKLISVSQVDGAGGFCQCDECKTIADQHGGVDSAPLVDFMNRLAVKTRARFPDLRLSTLAYLESYAPPSDMQIHEGVEIWLATDKHIWNHPYEFLTETEEFQAALKGWTDLGARVVVWDYTFGDNTHWLRPAPNLTVIDRNLDFLLEHGIKGIFWQDNYESPGKSRGPMVAWVMAKKAWNPQWNMDALVADFTEGVYGPAAGPMRAYNQLLQQEWETYHARPLPRGKFALSLGFVDTALALLEQASTLTTNPAVGDLIEREKMCILYERLERGQRSLLDEDSYREDMDAFVRLAGKFQVTSLAEGGSSVAGKVNQWTGGMIANDTGASVDTIISDSFVGAPATYSAGQSFAPSASSVGTSWVVSNGTVAAGDGQATLNGDGAAMSIGFGTVAPNTRATVSFEVRNLHQTGASYLLSFALKNSSASKSYVANASPNGGYYDASGFNSYDNGGNLIAGLAGAHLATNGAWDSLVYNFDPTMGVTLAKNGVVVASWPNFSNLNWIDSFAISAPSGIAPFEIRNFSVDTYPATTPMIIFDSFLGAPTTYGLGQTFASTASSVGTSWVVAKGTVSVGDGQATLNGDQAAMSIGFGAVAPNTPATISFEVLNPYQATGSYRLDLALKDSSTGLSYVALATPRADYFGTSGFNSYDNRGNLIAGLAGQQLSSNSTWDKLAFGFDPAMGVTLKKNGVLIASWTNFSSLNQVDTFTISAPSGSVPFAIRSFSVDARPAYAEWAAINASNQDANLDNDQDGVSNGVEYFMNAAAGTTANPGLVNGSVTWPNGGNIPSSAYGSRFAVQTSNDLANWTDVASDDINLSNTEGALTWKVASIANGDMGSFIGTLPGSWARSGGNLTSAPSADNSPFTNKFADNGSSWIIDDSTDILGTAGFWQVFSNKTNCPSVEVNFDFKLSALTGGTWGIQFDGAGAELVTGSSSVHYRIDAAGQFAINAGPGTGTITNILALEAGKWYNVRATFTTTAVNTGSSNGAGVQSGTITPEDGAPVSWSNVPLLNTSLGFSRLLVRDRDNHPAGDLLLDNVSVAPLLGKLFARLKVTP